MSLSGANSTDQGGTITSYSWSFGDGATASGATASHTYATAGTFQVSLTVVDNLGATSVATTATRVSAASAGGTTVMPPSIGSCTVFPADNIWNTPVDQLPVSSNSAAWVNTIGTNAPVHADFGSGLYNGAPIGIPFITVPGTQTKYPATFQYASESDPGPYAVPLNAPIEGGSQSTGDRHAIAIDTDNCILYELYSAYPQTSSWQAGSGAIFNLLSDALRPATWTSADAAGLPIFPGLMRYDEIVAGVINHAIRFTVPQTQNTFVWPARHYASSLTGSQYPPMGARFRLKASFDISSYSATNQIILQALKKYGMMLADNGSSWYLSGAPDSRWDNNDLHNLGQLTGADFEAVDVSSLMIDPNSGSARQTTGGSAGQPLQFVPLPPCRVADTRNAAGPFGGPALAASISRDFAIAASACGIPSNAQAYSLNITVVPLGPLGFISVWPAGQTQPVVSTLNSTDGRIKANAAIVPAGANGAISVFASNPTHVIIDINGYFVSPGAQSLAFYPLTPCRIADTRLGTGTFAGPSLAPSVARNSPILSSSCNVPANAQAYALNMTVVPSGTLGFLSTWPTGYPQPGSSTLNAPTGAVTANAAIVPAGAGGAIRVIATNTTDLIIDINGYFAPAGGPGALSFYAVTPCRIADTRRGCWTLGRSGVDAAAQRSFPIPSSGCQIPANAPAYSLNATVVPPAGLGFLTVWGNGAMPTVSTLNDSDGSIVANAAIVQAAGDGSVTVFASNATHLILDINGYFGP